MAEVRVRPRAVDDAGPAAGKEGHRSPEDWKKKNEEVNGKASAILLDVDGKVGKAYEAKVTPTMCVIDGKGIRVYDGAIDDNPMAQGDDIAKAKCYVQEVLDAPKYGTFQYHPSSGSHSLA